MRLVIAECSVDYVGRLRAHLPRATRLLMVKNDGSVLIHSDGGSYKPLNWMSPPATMHISDREELENSTTFEISDDPDIQQLWRVQATKSDDYLLIRIFDVVGELSHDLGVDPGLVKDGVEADLQRLLAEQ
ncbi:MAG: endonuclease NucS, partial [Rothia sp. (in: high G+C Gram-positive bacteria)]|nr:endonuclease NucS [Rothia sp. (in: high G+C Gram-positive bacteria)]